MGSKNKAELKRKKKNQHTQTNMKQNKKKIANLWANDFEMINLERKLSHVGYSSGAEVDNKKMCID